MSDPRARSFDGAAADYERHRPEYPADAIRWAAETLGLTPGARVLDIGAGTGKLTRGLLAHGFEVVAVEPGEPMLEQLRLAVPAVEAALGAAEEIPLPDASVAAAFAGQAYHWFDAPRALPELHRVVRPGGGLGLLWNWWDVRDPLQVRLLRDVFEWDGAEHFGALPNLPWFGEITRVDVESTPETTPDELCARLATTSRLLTAEPDERDRILDGVRRLATARGERFPLPQVTHVLAYRRLA